MRERLRRAWRRGVNSWRPFRGETEARREVDAHLALIEEELAGQGMSPADAHTDARRRFGSPAAVRDSHRDARSFRPLCDFVADVRYGVRSLRRSPAFALMAVLILSIGLGGVTAVFSAINAVFLRPLPYASADRLIFVEHSGLA